MKVRVKLFAAARELAGHDCVELSVAEPATVGNVREALAAQFPQLEKLAQHAMFALGTEYADDHALVTDADEVACIPPVSGG